MRKKRRDWFRIIRDLMDAGVSMARIASECGRDTTTVQHWADEGEPKESDARIVLALYAKFCPEKYLENKKEFDIPDPVIHMAEILDYTPGMA